MFNVYNHHKGASVRLPDAADIGEVSELAAAYAANGSDALLRVFKATDDGERFTVAFSVLDGKVTIHPLVNIPTAHW